VAWVFEERKDSGKFSFSDDGSARGSIALVARSDDWGATVPAANAPAPFCGNLCETGDGSLVEALKSAFPIGEAPGKPSNWSGEWHSTWCCAWIIEGYKGAIPTGSAGNVWYVDVRLNWVGDVTSLQGSTGYDACRPRRDVEILQSAAARRAPSWACWDCVASFPTAGDVDWSAASAIVDESAERIDVNGAPTVFSIPQVRYTVNVLMPWKPEYATKVARNWIGKRNDTEVWDWEPGKLLLEGVDCVQVGHGFQRYSLRILADKFYHLDQQYITNTGNNAPSPLSIQTSVGGSSQYVISHARAVWRQHFGFTADGWGMADLFYWESGLLPANPTTTYLECIIPSPIP
tara:strand:+ start:3066 stop:4106 length:1041 start_codon:yes stop_codon:yes gene_type:complete